MKRKPIDSQAAMAEGVDFLLREFRAMRAPSAPGLPGQEFEQFTGPIEPMFLVAAADARSAIRLLADFKCDGVDDDEEIQAAIDAAEIAGGGIVVLTEGAFACTLPVSVGINGGCVLRGQGIDITVLTFTMPSGTGTGALLLDSLTYAGAEELSVVVIDAGTANYAVHNNASGGGHLTNVSVKMEDTSRFGAFLISGTDIACKGLRVPNGSQGWGIATSGAYLDMDDCIVAGTSVVGGAVQGEAFYSQGGGPVTFKGCKVKSTVNGDGFVTFGFNYIYTGCVSETSTGHGFLIGGSDNVVIGNVSRDSTGNGIYIVGDRCVIAGNQIKGIAGNGIEITAAADLTMLGTNLITGVSGDDIVDGGTNTVNTDWLANPFYNGTMLETMRVVVTESAGTVTMALDQAGGGDLTMRFSDGRIILDTTPAVTIVLTTGSDNAPTSNFIYIPQSTKVLTKSTSDFPTDTEHIKVAFFSVPSAAFVAANGLRVFQIWTDHAQDTSGQGHMADISERLRREPAKWHSGLSGAGTTDYLTIVGTTVDLKITSGFVYQMHKHTVPAFDTSTSDMVLVKNWSGDAWHDLTNLYDIVADSTGTTIGNNKYFNLLLWRVANETSTFDPTIINLPAGFYTSLADAENDVDGFDDLTIPREFLHDSSAGFLIARITVQKKTSTWEYKSTRDLRGSLATVAVGGAAGVVTDFSDNQFSVFNVDDVTKEVALDVSQISTGTKRTYVMPDADGTLALEGAAVALGGGATPTLGTIGGSGPTSAAQVQWIEVEIGGIPHWIPVWT